MLDHGIRKNIWNINVFFNNFVNKISYGNNSGTNDFFGKFYLLSEYDEIIISFYSRFRSQIIKTVNFQFTPQGQPVITNELGKSATLTGKRSTLEQGTICEIPSSQTKAIDT